MGAGLRGEVRMQESAAGTVTPSRGVDQVAWREHPEGSNQYLGQSLAESNRRSQGKQEGATEGRAGPLGAA